MPPPAVHHIRSSSATGPSPVRIAVCALAALALAAFSAPAWAQTAAQKAPVVIKTGEQETSILADQLQQVGGTTDLLVAVGNVELTQGASRLLADRVELNRDTGEAVAQGKVVFFDGQDRLVGDRIDYNLKTGTGVVYNGSTTVAPYYHLSGERMDRIGDGVYQVRRGVFTTCEGDDPDWSFKFGSAKADLNDLVYGTGASFWVRNIPLLPYVPFFAAAIRRERQSGFLLPDYGTSSTKGTYVKVPYYWAINDSQDATITLDTFTGRGVGGEAEYRYVLSEQARGIFRGFLIPELLRNKTEHERLDIPVTRGFLAYKHDWQITPRLSFKVDANATTDDLVFREYGDPLADRARQRAETNIFLTQRWDSWSLTGNVLWYQDLTTPVATELQRVPEIRLFGVRQPLPGLPGFLYETEASFTNFYRVVGDGGARLDWHPRVYYPIPVSGLFTVTPFGGGRLTFYNQRAVGTSVTHGVDVEDTIYEPHVRRQLEGGFDVETRAARVFQLDGWGGLSALQHVVEPRAGILLIRGYDQKANPQYDPAIDRIGRVTFFNYSLINRINAKTLSAVGLDSVKWEAARLTLTQIFDIDRAVYQSHPFKDLNGELIVDPSTLFRFRAAGAYNMYGLGLRSGILDLTANYRDVSLTVGARYDAIAGTNFLTAKASARILHNLDAHVGTNWDVLTGTGVEHRVGIDWRFQCFALMAEYVYRYNNEDEFRFSVNLLGVGQTGSKIGTGQ